MDNDLLDDGDNPNDSKRPIFAPKNGKGKDSDPKRLSKADPVGGSENSLLNLTDEEIWLRKGMDEDGSFREGRYAD